jgi:hypothetical protein
MGHLKDIAERVVGLTGWDVVGSDPFTESNASAFSTNVSASTTNVSAFLRNAYIF